MIDNLRVVRYYKTRFVSTTQGAVNHKEYTGRFDIQTKVLVNNVIDGKVVMTEEWQSISAIDIEG